MQFAQPHNLRMKTKVVTGFVVLMLASFFHCYPQFNGGMNDGVGNGIAYGMPVEGNKTFSSVFYGGQNDGFSYKRIHLHMSGISPVGRFSGGLGEGTEQEQAAFSLNGTSLYALFTGGKSEGHDVEQYSVFPSGIAANDLYSGGIDEGFAISLHSNNLQNDIPVSMYAGGENEGTFFQAGYDRIAAPDIDMFIGSSNDGHYQKNYRGLLDMDAYYTIFPGGADDGFTIEVQSVTLTNGSVGTPKRVSTNSISVYPNPVNKGIFYVRLSKPHAIDENLQLHLNSIDGKEIPVEIDIMDDIIKVKYHDYLTQGAYILTLRLADNTHLKATIIVN